MSNILGILAGALLSSDGAPDGQSVMVRVHSPTHSAVYAYGKEPSGTPALRAHSRHGFSDAGSADVGDEKFSAEPAAAEGDSAPGISAEQVC